MTEGGGLSRRIIFIFALVAATISYHTEVRAAQLTLQWTDNSSNESGFKIERKTGPAGTYAQVATTGVNATSYTDTSVATGTAYCYRVLAYNTAGDSGYSNEACGTTHGPSLVSAIAPVSRSVQVGNTATAYALALNYGTATALGCGISPISSLPAAFFFQALNCATNLPVAALNIPVDIPANGSGCFIFALTPSSPIAPTDVTFNFDCMNSAPAPITPGVNTFLFSASSTPTPDLLATAATTTGGGIVDIPGPTGTNFIAMATVNVGAEGTITAEANTGNVSLPVTLSICQTDPMTATCINPSAPASSATMTIGAGGLATFTVIVQGSGTIPFDPGVNRIFLSFHEGSTINGTVRGRTSVAVRTQ
jgi:hypothetical protein